MLCVAIPWLTAGLYGPSPSVVIMLLSALCLAGLWGGLPWLQRVSGASGPAVLVPSLAWGWLLASLLSSAMALCQFFDLATHWEPWVSASSGIAYANLRQRNQFASLTVIGLVALLYLCAVKPSRAGGRGVAPVLAVLLLMAGNAASASRTGLVALLAIGALVMGWRGGMGPPARRWALLAVAAYLLSALLLPVLAGHPSALTRFASGDEPCSSRLTLWSNVLHLIAQKPWWGWGWGELDYAHFITLYPGERFCAILDNAHNLPLHLAVEEGIPLALLVSGAFALWLLRRRPWAEANPARQLAWGVLAVILLHSMLEHPLWYGPFQMAFLLCLAVLWRRAPASDAALGAEPAGASAQVLRGALACAVVACVGYAAWDYHRISQIYLAPEQRAAAYRSDTLAKISASWLFRGQVQFAELTTTSLTPANAAHMHSLANDVLHFSPEPAVVQKLIESAVMLHQDDEALYILQRFKAAFPEEHKAWAGALQPVPQAAPAASAAP